MALIKCKECGSEVSSKAETCPKCGARVAPKTMGCGTVVGIVFLGGLIISIFSNMFSPGTENHTATTIPIPSSTQVSEEDPSPVTAVPGSQWSYSQDADAMSKGTTYHAWVLSSNTVNFDFPYSGEQHATLSLRDDPRYGKDVIFRIEKGQILCHSFEDCTVLVRFDDGKASHYTAVGPADNSTETVFIRNYSRFVGNMLKAKRVRISTNIYQEGAPVFEFDVSGFNQKKYKPKK